ncbi:MAG TPA: cellulase family glycosylhydrolase [Candidatus Sulfopaludibacter sp.]|nr:cellulase family glycosylhydrolase [Candidatus Sulfopaludibacter sp.]
MNSVKTTFAVLAWLTLLYGKGNGQPLETGLLASPTRPYDSTLAPMSLHTKGARVVDTNNRPVRLCGVNIASLEYRTDGDHVQESMNRAINDWKVNLIRLPLAQDRWFGKMKDQHDGGAAYRAVVDHLVDTCAAAHVYIDLDLHWSDCGKWVNAGGRLGQHNMPDPLSIVFWHDVATRYKNHPNVIFGLYNEPHDVSWGVWRNGGMADDKPPDWNPDQTRTRYDSVGMQQLYDAVRATGAQNVVTVAGLDWGFDLSGVLDGHAITGTNYVYETHPYPNKKDWDKSFGALSLKYPLYVGEWGFGGQSVGGTNGLAYGQRLMDYVKQHDIPMWTAWDFSATAGPTMFKNWSYEPTVFGKFVKKQLIQAAAVRDSIK